MRRFYRVSSTDESEETFPSFLVNVADGQDPVDVAENHGIKDSVYCRYELIETSVLARLGGQIKFWSVNVERIGTIVKIGRKRVIVEWSTKQGRPHKTFFRLLRHNSIGDGYHGQLLLGQVTERKERT